MSHMHGVVFRLGDHEELYDLDCAGGVLCASTAEDRVSVAFVSAERPKRRRVRAAQFIAAKRVSNVMTIEEVA